MVQTQYTNKNRQKNDQNQQTNKKQTNSPNKEWPKSANKLEQSKISKQIKTNKNQQIQIVTIQYTTSIHTRTCTVTTYGTIQKQGRQITYQGKQISLHFDGLASCE